MSFDSRTKRELRVECSYAENRVPDKGGRVGVPFSELVRGITRKLRCDEIRAHLTYACMEKLDLKRTRLCHRSECSSEMF